MIRKTALPVAVLVAVFFAVWPTANALAQNTCPGCSEPNTNLFPQGFGPHTYTRWKPFQGVIDDNCPGYPDPAMVSSPCNYTALYLQNMSDFGDPAAAVAAIEGFDNQSTTALTKLQFDRRTDGGCTAFSPRFSIRTKDNKYSVGCMQMAVTNMFSAVDGKGNTNNWDTRTATFPVPQIGQTATLVIPPGSSTTIISLAIIYDDGAKSVVPGPGFVYLDNIEVCATNLSAGCKLWTQPLDNSEH